MQQQQEIDTLKRKIVLLESDLDKVESARDIVVEQKKTGESDLEEANREIIYLKQTTTKLEGKITSRRIYTCICQALVPVTIKIE